MKKYNLGCGNNKLEDFVNVDREDFFKPDLIVDLENFPWNIESNSAEVIVLNHVLEHLKDLVNVMKELYRISVNNTEIYITVPHPLSYDFIVDPTHITRITPETLNMFSKKFCDYVIENNYSNSTFAYTCNVDFEIRSVDYILDQQTKEFLLSKELISTDDYQNNHSLYDKIFPNLVKEIRISLVVRK